MSGRGVSLLGETLPCNLSRYTFLSINLVVILVGRALSGKWRPISGGTAAPRHEVVAVWTWNAYNYEQPTPLIPNFEQR
jgi:hypothetical protein